MTTQPDPTTNRHEDERSMLEDFRIAETLLADRRPRDAARLLEPVVEAEPDNAAVWELYGRALFAAAWLVPAERAFRRLIELEPSSGWAQAALGRSLDRQSKHREGAVHHRIADAFGGF